MEMAWLVVEVPEVWSIGGINETAPSDGHDGSAGAARVPTQMPRGPIIEGKTPAHSLAGYIRGDS
jgi:hypothetical protein